MNFNQTPYFDDFDEQNQYYKILFRPGVAVQTREMNQLQSILQNQVAKVGDHLFKDGSMVIPGNVQYNDKVNYIRIASTNLGTLTLADLEDKFVSSSADGTGVVARVLKAMAATGTDPITLILLYTASDETVGGATNKVFAAGATLYLTDDSAKTLIAQSGTDYSGRSAYAFINDGVYYVAKTFARVATTSISVKKYADTVSDINARIGIQYTESIVTADSDSSLNDNAAGSPNLAAPGAHRYKIDVDFVQCGLEDNPENFYELIRIESGVVQQVINGSQYNILQETLARRTFDESGNYVVEDFKFEVREARLNDRGTWAATQTYEVNDYVYSTVSSTAIRYFECIQSGITGASEPANLSNATIDETTTVTDGSVVWRYVAQPIGNRGVSVNGSSSNLVAVFGKGKAYIQGYETLKLVNTNVTLSKARDTRTNNNRSIPLNLGNYIYVDKNFSYGIPDVSTMPQVALFDRVVGNRNIQKFGYGQQVGSARISWVDPDARGGLKVSLSDINMRSGKSFDRDVNSLVVFDTTTSITQTSYTLTGNVKYAGNATSSFLTLGNVFNAATTSVGGTVFTTVTGTLTAFTQDLVVGDTIAIGASSSFATVSSWVVSAINSNTNMTIFGPAIATAVANTSLYVRVPAQTVLGMATGNAVSTRFQSEFRSGDVVWLGVANSATTGTVVNIISENRMIVSSNQTTLLANTSIGTYYAGRTATFAADVWGNYQLGINARKLTGNFQLLDYTGGTTTVQAHGALRIQGTNDSKLLSELGTNDYVDINNRRLFVTKVSSNSIAYAINLDQATIAGSTTSFPAFKVNNNLNQTSGSTLLFPVAEATSSIVDNIFTVYKVYTVSGVNGLSAATVTLASASGNAANEALATTDANSFFVAQDVISNLSTPLPVSAVQQIGLNVTVSITGTFSSNTAKIIMPVVRSAVNNTVLGRVKSKTFTASVFDDFLGTSAATRTSLRLSRSDIFKVVKILQATTFTTTWGSIVQAAATDVTSRYQLDDGQRDCFYDYGSVRLRSGMPPATGSIRVYYDYFEHSTGDFFARSSYAVNTHPYEKIPSYKNYNLADVLDFRPRINSAATGLVSNGATPRFGTNFTADVSFYLGRKESIFLDKNSSFYNVSGVSDTAPEFPKLADTVNSVKLYDLTLKPYTRSSDDPNVTTVKFENRRYTMKDIGNVEQRVTNLESVTSLNLLEAKTKNLQIRDNLDSTLERYKTGFFVDNFTDLSNTEITGDGRFTMDMDRNLVQPNIVVDSIPLVEKINYTSGLFTSSELTGLRSARASENYAVTGDLMTLKYTTSTVLRQDLATTSISVAPFLTATFLGNLKLVPEADIYETYTYTENYTTGGTTVIRETLDGGWGRFHSTIERNVTTLVSSTRGPTTLLPYCRAQSILWKANGLRPNAKYYCFFDDQRIDNYMTGAVKMTFDNMPLLDFNETRANAANEVPRRRSEYISVNTQEVGRGADALLARQGIVRTTWVYDYGWYHLRLNPKDYETFLPSAATRDAFKLAFAAGPCVFYYEGTGAERRLVGSAVAALQDLTTLYLVNARGKLSPSFIRTSGSYNYSSGQFYVGIDGSEVKRVNGTVTAASALTQGTDNFLYSDSKGNVVAVLDLPNTDLLKFLSGRKPVVITDHPDNDADDWTARATAEYYAQGTNVQITNSYITTKTYVQRYYDPIAQSFKLPDQYVNGAYISDVDLYFQQKPLTEKAPIHLDIRVCDESGRPSANELVPGAAVTLYPEDVITDQTGRTPTKFKFAQPVYLMPNKHYAIVPRCDTKNYRVWIATLGQQDIFEPTKTYTTNVLFGSLFKSQDGILWTEDQLSDVKFRLNRCVFSTADTGARAHVVTQPLGTAQLPNNPLTLVHGSNKIRVGHRNHGFASGDTVRLYSSYWANQYALNSLTSINSIPVGEIFGTYVSSALTTYQPNASEPVLTISDVTLDTYTVTVSSQAIIAGGVTGVTSTIAGGNDISGAKNIQYQMVKPRARTLNFQPTTLNLTGKLLRGVTYDNDANTPTIPYSWYTQALNFNDINALDSSVVLLSELNEANRVDTSITINAGGTSQIWKNSFIGVINMSTTDDAVSPAVDLSTLYVDVFNHRIDNPTQASRLSALSVAGTTSTVLVSDIICTSNTTVTFDGNRETINTTTEGLFDNVVPGRYITVAGSSIGANNITSTGLLVLSVDNNGKTLFVSSTTIQTSTTADAITIRQFNDFTEEITTVAGNTEAKFITRVVNLRNPASQLKMIVEACVPNAADFDVYYKTGASGGSFDTIIWNKFVVPSTNSSYVTLTKSDVRGDFTDVEFDISNFDSTGTPVDLSPFTAFQFKLVMRSSSSARVPQFRNLRVIAHA